METTIGNYLGAIIGIHFPIPYLARRPRTQTAGQAWKLASTWQAFNFDKAVEGWVRVGCCWDMEMVQGLAFEGESGSRLPGRSVLSLAAVGLGLRQLFCP